MTMMTADSGATAYVADTHDHADPKTQIAPRTMYLIAFLVVALAAGLTLTMGLGGLILWAVGATWIMLALLVVMTAGG
ncbi:hypothetical protein [uncultured Thioclava sp.]|jgi:fatty acid desaturase|uniref:Cytochrome c oxidase subunit IV bacterial aa3 type domain-containing protein n=1 Tax=Thioclava arctica TaxID=3238301 RepID=A0ABV3TN14_9RHOB|nr:hypothetical protein [uncultured Thioclava sp.]